MSRELDRILDANFNRVREGLRVAEELCRLVLEDRGLQRELKGVRHALAQLEKKHLGASLLASRDVRRDPGVVSGERGEQKRADWAELARANFRRAQEGLRVLEEVGKLIPGNPGAVFKRLRFRMYALEQRAVARLAPKQKVRQSPSRKGSAL
jgi:thiamine-phosphate pyrophosphorylase